MAVNAAAKAEKSQERFYAALRDLFVGAAVEGQSGFINLMRIKSRYYTEGVFPRLQQDIAAALESLGHDPNVRHSGSCPKPALLDAAGRKVAELQPGENDIRHLAPGVYFVREEGSRVPGSKGSSVRKVVVTR